MRDVDDDCARLIATGCDTPSLLRLRCASVAQMCCRPPENTLEFRTRALVFLYIT